MLFQYIDIIPQLCPNIKHNFSHTFTKKKIIDYFKGLLVTHHLDIFMSGKNLGLRTVSLEQWSPNPDREEIN